MCKRYTVSLFSICFLTFGTERERFKMSTS